MATANILLRSRFIAVHKQLSKIAIYCDIRCGKARPSSPIINDIYDDTTPRA
jgi:hypothetical protein